MVARRIGRAGPSGAAPDAGGGLEAVRPATMPPGPRRPARPIAKGRSDPRRGRQLFGFQQGTTRLSVTVDHPVSVSGIITAYDRPDFLREAIASALAQTRPLTELIVVDDGSPNELASVVASFGDRVRYLRLPTNRGANAARNAGVAAATGEVVAFLDDDDRWQPSKIESQLRRLQAGGYEAVLCGWESIDGSERLVHAIDDVTEAMLRRGNPYCGTSGLVAHRPVLLDEPFDETLPQGQEWDVYVRLAKRHVLAYVQDALYLRRSGPHASISSSSRRYSPEALLQQAAAARKHRAWLGERYYRERLAARLLSHLSQREAKYRYILYALRHAGLRATTTFLVRKAVRSWRRGRPAV